MKKNIPVDHGELDLISVINRSGVISDILEFGIEQKSYFGEVSMTGNPKGLYQIKKESYLPYELIDIAKKEIAELIINRLDGNEAISDNDLVEMTKSPFELDAFITLGGHEQVRKELTMRAINKISNIYYNETLKDDKIWILYD